MAKTAIKIKTRLSFICFRNHNTFAVFRQETKNSPLQLVCKDEFKLKYQIYQPIWNEENLLYRLPSQELIDLLLS